MRYSEARGTLIYEKIVKSKTKYIGHVAEAESKEKHGAWDLMPELTITSPYVHSRVDSNTFTTGNPMP